MKPGLKTNLKSIPVLISFSFFLLCGSSSVFAEANREFPADTGTHASKVREVLTSQQLFAVKLSNVKKANAKPGTIDFKAENRDAFMIICYDNDKSYTELNWAMCPNGKCPIPGTYEFGTPQYKQLDTLIAQTKQANAQAMKKLNALKADAKKGHH